MPFSRGTTALGGKCSGEYVPAPTPAPARPLVDVARKEGILVLVPGGFSLILWRNLGVESAEKKPLVTYRQYVEWFLCRVRL